MTKLNPHFIDVLDNVREGNNDTHQLVIFTKLPLDKVLTTLTALEKEGLVTITKKLHDKTYGHEFWIAEISEKGNEKLDEIKT